MKLGADKKSLISLIKRNKFSTFVCYGAVTLAVICSALLPVIVGQLFGVLDGSTQSRKLVVLLILLFSLSLLHSIFIHSGARLHPKYFLKMAFEYKKITFEKAWEYDYGDFVEKPSGKVASCVNQLYIYFYQALENIYFQLFYVVITMTVFLFTLTFLIWQNAVYFIVFTIAAYWLQQTLLKRITKNNEKLADRTAMTQGKVFDSFSNFVNVFSFNQRSKETAKMDEINSSLFSIHKETETVIRDYYGIASIFLRTVLWGPILWFNYVQYSNGNISAATFGTTIAILANYSEIYFPLTEFVADYSRLSSSFKQNYTYLFGDRNVVEEYYAEPDSKTDGGLTPVTFESHLELKNLNFAYPDRPDEFVLKNINITLHKNEKIGIVGKSGGGKSTLVKLLLGFYSQTNGEILLDGKPMPTDELSNLFSYIPQDTSLFQDTIEYNIAYGTKTDITDEMLLEASVKAHADDFVSELSDSYQTLVGERGIKLSMGQRQRIAIARAMLKNTDFLILDEATSALDSHTEKKIQDAIENLWEEKTVIAIAHRLSTINNVDKILVVDNGEIVEVGSKEELLAKNGAFKELWDQQKKGMI